MKSQEEANRQVDEKTGEEAKGKQLTDPGERDEGSLPPGKAAKGKDAADKGPQCKVKEEPSRRATSPPPQEQQQVPNKRQRPPAPAPLPLPPSRRQRKTEPAVGARSRGAEGQPGNHAEQENAPPPALDTTVPTSKQGGKRAAPDCAQPAPQPLSQQVIADSAAGYDSRRAGRFAAEFIGGGASSF